MRASGESPPLRERVVEFRAGDGLPLNLVNVRGPVEPTRGPVLLVHGAGVRAGIFRPPVPVSIVDVLVARGYDVWLENWRASVDLPPNPWTLDQAALHDHPAAVRTVVAETGSERVKAIVQCQGSSSLIMSAIAGRVPQVTTIVSNAVSLHPVVPPFSALKARLAVPLLSRLTPYLNPQWGLRAPGLTAKFVSLVVRLTHHECDNAVCKQVSFTYGTGFPALWSHANLTSEVHEWIKGEFAHVPLSFFRQMRRCIAAGRLLAAEEGNGLPRDFAAVVPETDARIVFLAGARNRCFLPESQVRSFRHFDGYRKGFHALHVLPGYGHVDVFIGRGAARDVFPLILEELEGR